MFDDNAALDTRSDGTNSSAEERTFLPISRHGQRRANMSSFEDSFELRIVNLITRFLLYFISES